MESLLSLSKKMEVIKKVKPLEIAFCIFKNVLSSPENTLLLMGYSVTIRFLKNRAIVTFQHVRKTRYARFAHSCILQKKDFLLHYKSLVFFWEGVPSF